MFCFTCFVLKTDKGEVVRKLSLTVRSEMETLEKMDETVEGKHHTTWYPLQRAQEQLVR